MGTYPFTQTKEEDALLIQLVKENGAKNWSSIAKKMKGRMGKQCRERWHNHLNPDIRKQKWTEEEDRIIIQCHSKYVFYKIDSVTSGL